MALKCFIKSLANINKTQTISLFKNFCSSPKPTLQYADPYVKINECFVKPLYEKYYNPSVEKQLSIQRLLTFTHRGPSFVKATSDASKIPDIDLPEILFLGRSNVGKSSLINALLNTEGLAWTSGTPGFTKSLNFYRIGNLFCLVDAPGYEYREPVYLNTLLHQYLVKRYNTNFRCAFILLDSKIGLSDSDIKVIQKFESLNLCYAFVFTKIDKGIPYHIHERLEEVKNKIGILKLKYLYPGIFLTSIKSLEGIGVLQSFIVDLLQQEEKQSEDEG